MQVHKKLEYYINAYHYNHSALAKAVGIDPSTLHLKLRGDRKLTADEFVNLCSAMGVDCSVIDRLDVPVEEYESECTDLMVVESEESA